MKIAVISSVPGNPWAGSEELWYQTSLELLAEGHQVFASVFEVGARCEQLDNFKAKGGIIDYRKRFKNGRLFILKHKFLSAFNNIFKWDPDVILFSLGNLDNLTLYPDLERHIKKNTKARIVIVSLFNSDTQFMNDFARQSLGDFCRRADHFVFVSRQNYLLAERQLALKLKNVSIFSSPVSYVDSFERLPWPEDKTIIQMACAARLDIPHKGHDVLLEALSGHKWKKRAWQLNIFGNGDDKGYIEELIKMYGLEDKVVFGGFVSDTRDIWKANHMLVMASRAEGLSLAVLEAMICGRICVVTDVGGHAEVIVDSVSGFIAEASTAKYFDAALERAWNLKLEFDNIAEKAHLSALEVFEDEPIQKMKKILLM